jgi:hypothetical protein
MAEGWGRHIRQDGEECSKMNSTYFLTVSRSRQVWSGRLSYFAERGDLSVAQDTTEYG